MPRQFRFGSDPEFIFVSVRQDGRTGQIGTTGLHRSPVSHIVNHTGLGEIGMNGCASTAEIRTHPHPTLATLEREIIDILNSGANALNRMPREEGRYAMMFGGYPHNVPCGGHIHITSDDPMWYWSKESFQVVPFFISLATYMYDKAYLRRIEGSSYGQHGDIHVSPDQPTRATITPPEGRPVPAWPGGFRGWEYRNPTSWIAPQNVQYRRKLFAAINGVLGSEGDLDPPTGEKEKQLRFVGRVCAILGGGIQEEVGQRSQRSYDAFYGSLRSGAARWLGEERALLRGYFNNPPSPAAQRHIGKLLSAVQQAQDEVRLVGFDEIFNDIVPNDPWRNDDLNPPVTYPMPAPPLPIRLASFRSMADAITALRGSYAAYVESTNKGDWMSFGRSWYDMFPCRYVMDGDVARDVLVPEIAHTAMALCVDAVQRRSLKVKFLPRSTERSMIYGGGEQRSFPGRAADVVALAPAAFARDPAVREMMAGENLTVAEGGDDNIYLRMSFRESPSDLRHMLVAAYILWRQQYIGTAAGAAKHITAAVPWREGREGGEVTG